MNNPPIEFPTSTNSGQERDFDGLPINVGPKMWKLGGKIFPALKRNIEKRISMSIKVKSNKSQMQFIAQFAIWNPIALFASSEYQLSFCQSCLQLSDSNKQKTISLGGDSWENNFLDIFFLMSNVQLILVDCTINTTQQPVLCSIYVMQHICIAYLPTDSV